MQLDKETQTNIKALITIRDDLNTSPAVRIQAIQTMQKIMDNIGATASDDRLTTEDIMKKIRRTKK